MADGVDLSQLAQSAPVSQTRIRPILGVAQGSARVRGERGMMSRCRFIVRPPSATVARRKTSIVSGLAPLRSCRRRRMPPARPASKFVYLLGAGVCSQSLCVFWYQTRPGSQQLSSGVPTRDTRLIPAIVKGHEKTSGATDRE